MHTDEDGDPQGHRAVFLGAMIGVMAGCGLLLVSFLLCGGLTFYVLGLVLGLGLFGYFHYLLWGRSLSQEVSGEREEDEE